MANLGVLCLTICCAFLPFNGCFGAESTLRFLTIVHRHGERAPITTYPKDPYRNDSLYWPEGREELLKVGKVNMYAVGKLLRKRYDGFLPSIYKASEVLVRSTSTNRAIMSAQLVLAGLYPPVKEQIWNSDLLWQPIPVQVLSAPVDNMLCVSRPCPKLYNDHETFKAGLYQEIRKKNQEIVDYLRNHTGLDFKSDSDFSTVYDNLLIEDEQGLKLPEWTKKIYPDKIRDLYFNTSFAFKKTPTYTRINSGILIDDILTTLKKKRDEKNKNERLLNLYAAHDSTIFGLWRGMGITQEEPLPSFGALFIMELHEIEKKYKIKIWYKNRATDKDLYPLTIKNCKDTQGWCDLDVLDSLMKSAIITDFDKECYSPNGPNNLPPKDC